MPTQHKFKMRRVYKPLAILGAGSWGTALAIHLAKHGEEVHLWGHQKDRMLVLKTEHENPFFLPGLHFPPSLKVFDDLNQAIEGCQDIFIVVPSFGFRPLLQKLSPLIRAKTRILWGTKGLDAESFQLLSQTVEQILGKRPMAILSGPSFAKEVAIGLPTAVVIASKSKKFQHDLVERFHHQNFRVYTSSDIVGVQLGGAIKNVIAIGVGISDGMGFGANARCALITRGLAEIRRLGLAMGGKSETFMGLSGAGDLILTCTDNQSRNRRLGLALGEGHSLSAAEKNIGQVAEGAHTAAHVVLCAQHYHVEMPICFQVNRILKGETTPRQALLDLLARDFRSEERQ